MKLFLATNSLTAKTRNIELLQKSVRTALINTDFEVFVLFDGKKEELNLPKNVNIIEHRHRCYDTFLKSGRDLQTSSGTFLRTEIPYLLNRLGISDKYCLYTDYDVIFSKGDYSYLDSVNPEIFGCCTEFSKHNWSQINAGVMLINTCFFYEQDEFIMNYINQNFDKLKIWDQSMYINLYLDKITRLPLEYNWKPYWGINEKAKIIHFHGPKPDSIEHEVRKNFSEIKKLRELNIDSFNYYSQLWEKI